MKLATLRTPEGPVAAIEHDGAWRTLPYRDLGALLASDMRNFSPLAPACQARDARFAPPIPHPGKIICVGANYQAHVQEMKLPMPAAPTLFAKFANALAGARDDLPLSSISPALDWEAELVVVMGKRLRGASAMEAEDAIFGFCIGNDVSARDLQTRTDQWLAGKTLDVSTPLGPWLITADETGPRPNLAITCAVNDETMQADRTGSLCFDPVDLIRDITRFATLEPGDLIFTGTPGGVGGLRRPPRFLRPGDILMTEIEMLGRCVNRIM